MCESKIAALAAPLCLCAERRGSRTTATLGGTSRAIPACARLSYRCKERAPYVSCITRSAFRDLLAWVFSRENEAASLGLSRSGGANPFLSKPAPKAPVYSRVEGGILARIACQSYDHGRFTGRRQSFSVVRKRVPRRGPDATPPCCVRAHPLVPRNQGLHEQVHSNGRSLRCRQIRKSARIKPRKATTAS